MYSSREPRGLPFSKRRKTLSEEVCSLDSLPTDIIEVIGRMFDVFDPSYFGEPDCFERDFEIGWFSKYNARAFWRFASTCKSLWELLMKLVEKLSLTERPLVCAYGKSYVCYGRFQYLQNVRSLELAYLHERIRGFRAEISCFPKLKKLKIFCRTEGVFGCRSFGEFDESLFKNVDSLSFCGRYNIKPLHSDSGDGSFLGPAASSRTTDLSLFENLRSLSLYGRTWRTHFSGANGTEKRWSATDCETRRNISVIDRIGTLGKLKKLALYAGLFGLDLHGQEVLGKLSGLTSLKLHAHNKLRKDKVTSALHLLPNLRCLVLDKWDGSGLPSTSPPFASTVHLEDLPKLNYLEISGCCRVFSSYFSRGAPVGSCHLTELDVIQDTGLTLCVSSHDMPNLKSIKFNGKTKCFFIDLPAPAQHFLDSLASFVSLEKIEILFDASVDQDLSPTLLHLVRNLKELRLLQVHLIRSTCVLVESMYKTRIEIQNRIQRGTKPLLEFRVGGGKYDRRGSFLLPADSCSNHWSAHCAPDHCPHCIYLAEAQCTGSDFRYSCFIENKF